MINKSVKHCSEHITCINLLRSNPAVAQIIIYPCDFLCSCKGKCEFQRKPMHYLQEWHVPNANYSPRVKSCQCLFLWGPRAKNISYIFALFRKNQNVLRNVKIIWNSNICVINIQLYWNTGTPTCFCCFLSLRGVATKTMPVESKLFIGSNFTKKKTQLPGINRTLFRIFQFWFYGNFL